MASEFIAFYFYNFTVVMKHLQLITEKVELDRYSPPVSNSLSPQNAAAVK